MVYATTLQLNEMLGWNSQIPKREAGKLPDPAEELLEYTSSVFFFVQPNIISGTYTVYYGATVDSLTLLTETTHYTVDKKTGQLTLTGAGVTLVNGAKLFAKYQYNNQGFSDEFLQQVLDRAEGMVNSSCNTRFIDTAVSNPAYVEHEAILPSQGYYNRGYYVPQMPFKDISSLLSSNIDNSVVTIPITTGEGVKFPSTGSVIIGTEIIAYTGTTADSLTGCTRGYDNSTAAAHTLGDEIHTTYVKNSETIEGFSPVYQILEWNEDMFADEIGKVYIYDNSLVFRIEQGVPNRVKIHYLWGHSSIPKDITRLTLLFAKRFLISDNIGKSMIEGRNEFKPEMFNVDEQEIKRLVNAYIYLPMGNT
jgi:hypothetical protein